MASDDRSGDVDALLTAAAEGLLAFGAPFYLARVLLLHAEWQIATGAPAAAQPLLDQAQQIFTDLRARPWLDRALSAQTLVIS